MLGVFKKTLGAIFDCLQITMNFEFSLVQVEIFFSSGMEWKINKHGYIHEAWLYRWTCLDRRSISKVKLKTFLL